MNGKFSKNPLGSLPTTLKIGNNSFGADSQDATSRIKTWYFLFSLILPWIPYLVVRMRVLTAENNALYLMEERSELTHKIKEILHQRIVLQEKEHSLHDETGSLFSTLRKLGALEEYEAHEAIEERYLAQIDIMYEYFEQSSRRYLNEGNFRMPQNIDVKLKFRNEVLTVTFGFPDWKRNPTATYLFFNMVDQNIWEGSSITKKYGTQIISSQPTLSSFEDAQKWKLVVRDALSPSEKFSLCFKGLGPTFFISLRDETQETCFGKVMVNKELLEKMDGSAEILAMAIVPIHIEPP
jgi:hypothetical protein